jgi:ribosomal protein S18 acetylase RimI-like enzyme
MPIKYKKRRLQAISVAPTSFSSSHEVDNEWVNRLPENERETFICAARPTQDNLSVSQIPEQSIWVSQLTLRGLQRLEAFILPEESGQKKPGEEDQGLWRMLTLFKLPNHRGRGLGKRLCQEGVELLSIVSGLST